MGVANGCGYHEAGVVIRRWVWLKCSCLVGCCCKEVHRFPNITYSYSTCISSFFAAASLLLCSFFYSFVLVYVIFVQYSKHWLAQRTFEIVQKSRSC